MLLNPRPPLHLLRRAPLGSGLAGRPFALHILHEPRFLYVVLDDGPARPAVALVAAGHLPREVRRREVDELDAARVRPQPVVAPDARAPVDAFSLSGEVAPLVRWPTVRTEEDRRKIIRVLLDAQAKLFSLRGKYCQKGEEEKE